jgi:signal transduction histidine kinase
VPVDVDGAVVAALGVSRPGDIVDEADLQQLDAIARQLGLAADNVRHIEAERGAHREVADSRATLETYIQLAADAQEEERKRLARELHDETIQALVIARGDLRSTGQGAQTDLGRLSAAIAALDEIIADLRRFCRDLRPSVLDDLGLAQALDALTVELADRAGIDVSLTCEGTDARLDARSELILYRIAQEALRNVERHAAAAHAAVTLAVEPDKAFLRVTDDGRGFELRDDDAHLTDAGHLGLLGMHERAKALGAVLTIESDPGTGTLVEVLVPRR